VSTRTHIEILISRLEELSKIRSYTRFKKEANSILNEFGWSYHDGGAFTNVYTKPRINYVVKITCSCNYPFHPIEDYKEGYLKPIYMSKNRFLAIQDKVITFSDYYDECTKPFHKAQREYDSINKKAIRARKLLATAKKKYFEDMKVVRYSNIKRHRKIPDLRDANIGLHNGIPLMIDLNQHADRTYDR
jgi:hypothetical protein